MQVMKYCLKEAGEQSMDEIQNSLKGVLLCLLKDSEVQEKVREIVKEDIEQGGKLEQRLEELEKEKKALHHRLEEAHIECERLHKNCRKLEDEKAVLEQEKREIQKSKDEMAKQFQTQKKELEPFEELREIWQGLSKLDKSQKSYLKNLCGAWDIKSLIALGKDKNGIRQLWNFIKDEIMNSNRKMEHIKVLAKFFDLCISVYNSTNIRKEHYERMEVFIGKEYDSRHCIKTSESIVNGVVQEVLLNGYALQDDVMKPIVIVR